jgi:peptide/nickel transport system ATP-binding protein
MAEPAVLEVEGLVTSFRTDAGVFRAVDGVSFRVPRQSTVGLVGESGCGKSVTALSILRLIPKRSGTIERGRISLDGHDLLQLPEREMRKLRGSEVSMIFQEPMSSLNPVYSVGDQVIEAIRLHKKSDRRTMRKQAADMLGLVGIPNPSERMDDYPHQLSGGMRQRVMIAIALACEPKVLIADEPTTALDVTIQAQILELLARLQRELGMSILLITHDLGIVAEFVDHTVVMYAGEVVEHAPTPTLFANPLHPYTKGLLASVPTFDLVESRRRLPTIPGMVPDLTNRPSGCRFHDRCPDAIDICKVEPPPLELLGPEQFAACHVAAMRIKGEVRG